MSTTAVDPKLMGMGADVRPTGLIDLGAGKFDPWHIRPVCHRLSNHPLLNMLPRRDEFRERAHVFGLKPGQGAYPPSTSAHIENDDEPSITMSFIYLTGATRRRAMLHTAHAQMRSLGVAPPPVGRFAWLEAMALVGATALNRPHALRRRLAGNRAPADFARFAPVDQ